MNTQHNQPHTRSITKTSTRSNVTALLNVPLPACMSSPAMERSDISSCIDEASDIQLNPAQQKSYLRVNSKSYEIHEMHVPLHRNIMRRYWSIHIISEKELDSPLKQCCSKNEGQAQREPLIATKNDVRLSPQIRTTRQIPSDGIIARVNEQSFWVVK